MRLAACRAGLLPLLISTVGQDGAGDLLMSQWKQLGLSTQGIRIIPGLRTPTVSIIFDSGEQRPLCVTSPAQAVVPYPQQWRDVLLRGAARAQCSQRDHIITNHDGIHTILCLPHVPSCAHVNEGLSWNCSPQWEA